jgi:hypothetical protein
VRLAHLPLHLYAGSGVALGILLSATVPVLLEFTHSCAKSRSEPRGRVWKIPQRAGPGVENSAKSGFG